MASAAPSPPSESIRLEVQTHSEASDELSDVFDRVSAIMYRISGVNLTDGKKELVRARLSKRMRTLGWDSFSEYVDFVESDGGRGELAEMVDALTTNKTNFFRELPHFEFLRDEVFPRFRDSRTPLRIWSAGCSTGEEPYTLAILVRQTFKDPSRHDVRILGTDLSRSALAQARAGVYTEAQMEGVPRELRSGNFETEFDATSGQFHFRVAESLRSLVALAPLNLMERWPMRGPFNVIMCRNVMIYFDRMTREALIQRFTQLLPPGGFLMVGHSESLNGLDHELEYIQPAVYRK